MADLVSIEVDPCLRVVQLRAIRDRVITGGAVIEAEIEQGNGTRRKIKYSAADRDSLNREIIAATDACSALAGNARPGRFAIGGRVS